MNFFFKFQNLSTSLYSTNFYSLFMIVRGVQNLDLRFFFLVREAFKTYHPFKSIYFCWHLKKDEWSKDYFICTGNDVFCYFDEMRCLSVCIYEKICIWIEIVYNKILDTTQYPINHAILTKDKFQTWALTRIFQCI